MMARGGRPVGLLEGRNGLVVGVANKRSIAWGIAQALAGAGMRLAFTYQGERLRENVEALAGELSGSVVYPCDVTVDAEIDAVMTGIARDLGTLDVVVHSVAFAPREDLEGRFSDTTREGFRIAHDVSSYSLIALTRAAAPLLEKSGRGAVVAMTYYGSEKVAAGYNVMGVAKASLEAAVRYLAADLGPRGIRVNAVSAGPVNTLAARGVRGFTDMLRQHAEKAPLRRNVTLREIGDAALFLLSPMASGITGQVLFVDAGYQIMAV
jgi:enoyl-[acyl-carrier protein] reductase I